MSSQLSQDAKLEFAKEVASGIRLTRTAAAATYALLLFEFLLMFNREYEVVYKSRWSISKCLYLACRFCPLCLWPIIMIGFIANHDLETCKKLVIGISIVFMLLPCFPQCIFLLRAWAFMGAKRVTLLVFVPCLLAYIFFMSWFSLQEMLVFNEAFLFLGPRTGCFKAFPRGYNSYSRTMFVAIGLDLIVGAMLVIHCFRMHSSQTRLGKLLVTQGLLYYPLMLVLNTTTGVFTILGPSKFRGYDGIMFCTVVSISNILACRFVVQIREYAVPDSPESFRLSSVVRRDLHGPVSNIVDRSREEILAASNKKSLTSESYRNLSSPA